MPTKKKSFPWNSKGAWVALERRIREHARRLKELERRTKKTIKKK